MSYKTEKDLQLELFATDFEFFDSCPVFFKRREVRVGECIPDLVSIHFHEDVSYHTWPKKWSYQYSYIVWLLRRWKCLTPQDIASLAYDEEKRIGLLIDHLIKNDIAFERETGEIMLSEKTLSVKAEVVAVEAKLRNWRDALSQAMRYKDFADLVIVAMDASNAPIEENIVKMFDEQKIGLCGVTHGLVNWIVYPRKQAVKLGHEKEYLVLSATMPSTQILWDKRNCLNASYHA